MSKLYIAFIDTPGFLATLIRKVLNQNYIHVAIALDPKLEQAYSIGRRNPRIPIISGFEKENKEKILNVFPTADYMICSIECTQEQRDAIQKTLEEAYEKRFTYHYAVVGLGFVLFQKDFHQKQHYTCSSYIAKILEDEGIMSWDKDYSCVTPKDFYLREDKQKIFEGKLNELCEKKTATYKMERLRGHFSKKVVYGQ